MNQHLRRYLGSLLATALVLGVASPAMAISGHQVYGTATLRVWAIEVSGPGSDIADPLVYVGNSLGAEVDEQTYSRPTITNTGNQTGEIGMTLAQAPTDGTDEWAVDTGWGTSDAVWYFDRPDPSDGFVFLGSSGSSGSLNNLAAGESCQLRSIFKFPASSSSMADHRMQATISIADPEL